MSDEPANPGETLARSRAFREASLRSEIRRAYAVIGIVAMVAVLVLTRGPGDLKPQLKIVAAAGVAFLFMLQVGALAFARWAQRRERAVPTWFVVAGVVAESLIPTGIMASHIHDGVLAPYASLSAPPVMAYGLMITLTTLRLRPWLCILAGAIAAAGYGGLL